MLQQTQTARVETKYEQFIAAFPTFECLAHASLRDVLSAWQGLGYYRRARYLHQIAQKVVSEHGGMLPDDPKILQTFPGLGAATAASICAFAFNKPTVFIETNIRTVFIHSFFQHKSSVSDKELMPFIAESLDHDNPREWYYALMDYGVLLKSQHINPSRKSAHYTKQSKFEGSDRQIRAAILKMITNTGGAMLDDFAIVGLDNDSERIGRRTIYCTL
jgi:A/G-specific adenine glycosylase